MTATREPVMGVAEVAEFLDVRKPNVRKLLERHGIAPYATLAVGPVYERTEVEALKRRLDGNARRQATNEKRRAAALAREERR